MYSKKEHWSANWMHYHLQVRVWRDTYSVGSDRQSCSRFLDHLSHLYMHVGSDFVCRGPVAV